VSKADDDGCVFGKCDTNGLCAIEHKFGNSGSDSTGASGWTAYEASDVAYAGGAHDRPIDGGAEIPAIDPIVDELNPMHAPEFSFALTFGCQTAVSGYFEKQLASGVMGLDRRAQSFWGQMRTAQVIHRAQFSLCFVKQPIASISGSTAGAVTLGGVDRRLHKTPMVFAKSVGKGNTASFKVRMRKMYLRQGNDQSVMSSSKSKYHLLDISEEWLNGEEMYNFDSGTTDTYLIQSLSNEFRTIWKDVTGMDYTNDPISFNSDSDLLKFPTLILQMIPHNGGIGDEVQTGDPRTIPGLAGNVDMTTPNDVMVAIPPKHYMQRNSKDQTYTSRIYLDRENALGNILGANAMMGHDILFDMDGARIGFAESDCDYAGLVTASAKGILEGVSGSAVGAIEELSPADKDDEYRICESMKCRGFFGLTLAVFFMCFFLFARRYVTKREGDGHGRVPIRVGSNEYEMKASSRNLHAGKGSSYSDEDDRHGDLPGGERVAYYDEEPSHAHSDYHRSSSRRDRSSSRESNRERRSSSERRQHRERGGGGQTERRSSSRDSTEGKHRSTHSIHSNRSQGSGSSGGSGGSRETKRSSRSHQSSRSRESHRSNRSSGSRESHRSRDTHRSRESQRSNGSSRHVSGSRHQNGRDDRRHHADGSDGRQSSSRSNRYRDQYEDVPMPPAIA